MSAHVTVVLAVALAVFCTTPTVIAAAAETQPRGGGLHGGAHGGDVVLSSEEGIRVEFEHLKSIMHALKPAEATVSDPESLTRSLTCMADHTGSI